MRRTQRVLLISALLASMLLPIQASAVIATNPTPDCSAGATCTVVFSATNDFFNWTVPAGITSLTVDMSGAQGGAGTSNGLGAGGKGGRVQATLTVTPGAILRISVGGAGAFNAAGGYNGGGTAFGISHGGSGGGGSDIRVSPYALANRVVVAGGGGGASGGSHTGVGGDGGGLIGQSIGNTCGSSFVGGGGGTQSAGGAKGLNYGTTQDGSFGQGGGTSSYHNPGGGGGWYGGGSGAVCGGGGGSSYTSPTLATSVTHTQGHKSGVGEVRVTYLNAPSVTTFTSSTASRTNTSSAISFSLSFSQNVNSVANSDFSNAGTATGCSFVISGSSGTNFTLTVSSCSEGTLIPQVISGSVFGTVTNSNGPTANTLSTTPITIDRTAPTISATLTGPINATYIPGQSLTFTAPFSETVTVTGTPRLALTIGSTTRYANYLSGTNTRTLTFAYVVQTALADVDTDGISLSTSLEPNSGSIQDLATNTLSNFTFTAPTLTSVLVAQRPAAPTITSITPSSGALSVAFTPGATNGSAITNYEFSTNNGVNWTTRNPVATSSPISITGLTNGQAYNVRLRAINGAGFGDSSTAVAATPSAVVVTGDASLTSIYGQSASTGTYSASGGTGGYTFSLSDTPTGVTINPSNGIVTTATTTPAGTYTQSVRATDGNNQVGTRSLTITVAKAATSITIALPNAATSAALGGAVTITATVPRAGAVNFRLAGATLTGCGAAAAASTTATCSWTPLALGSVALTAIFTPTDTANFETSTTTTLTITVVNGVSTVSLSLAGGLTQVPKGQAINIIAAIDQVGRITFLIDGKRIPGCFNLVASVIGNRSCSWKPAVQKRVNISARLVPTNNVFNPSVSSLAVQVVRRTGARSVGGGGIPSI